jgi:hypothetical protein
MQHDCRRYPAGCRKSSDRKAKTRNCQYRDQVEMQPRQNDAALSEFADDVDIVVFERAPEVNQLAGHQL